MTEAAPIADQVTGIAQMQHPLIRRLLAPNPSHFTYTGTQTYLIGTHDVAVIDPGPALDEHVDAIIRATEGAKIRAIMCTHTHEDHSPAAKFLKERTGAPIIGCAPLALSDDGPRADAHFDETYAPDEVLKDGQKFSGDGWTIEAIHTPGHTSNHLCFAIEEAKAVITGDHVMGWSTSVIAPPDGDMSAYMSSLEKLMVREQDEIYFPAHGDSISNPQRLVRGMIGHRKQREGQIMRQLEAKTGAIAAMVERMYVGVDKRLYPAAGLSVLAHLLDMEARGLVRQSGDQWMLAA